MNKRQAKKAYKKKYGHNPPKNWKQSLNIAFASFGESVKRAAEAIGQMLGQAVKAVGEATRQIQIMPEEDFIKLLESEDMDAQQRALLLTIRAKRKGEK